MGYAPPGTSPLYLIEIAQEAERLGYSSAWAAEAWGTDAVSVLSWLGASTSTINLGTAILQLPARTPSNVGMTAVTLDLLSGGRVLLGLGTSGPQVVEGWHGEPWGKPLRRTREYVEIVRAVIRRDVLEFDGEHYQVPYRGDGATGLGKPLKLMARPLRDSIPIYLASLRPKSVALAAEIADGWLPIFFSPERARATFPEPFAREGLEIAPAVPAVVADLETARDALRPYYALYVGGMGARGANFYNDLARAYGFEARGGEDPGPVPGRPPARRRSRGARPAHRRDGARRAARAHPRAARRVARVGRDRAADLDPRPGDAAHGRGGGRMTVRDLFDLSGRVAIVTGGGKGIGLQMATGLAELGADLLLCARKSERCEAAAEELSEASTSARSACAATCPIRSRWRPSSTAPSRSSGGSTCS